MDLFTTQQLKTLNDLELGIYQYVQKNMAKIDKMKIRELAGELHCSTTTILRFCRKLDCNGYSEFKLRLKMLSAKNNVERQPVSEDWSVLN
jgi:DNA-binding MurR/RpiR family transcriptional regulator